MSSNPRPVMSRQPGGSRVPAPQLGGTGRLADELYLMAHNDVSGKPYLQSRALGLGLAGCLLGELALSGTIRVRPDAVLVTGSKPAGEDLARHVLGLVLGEREPLAARVWLLFLARTAPRDVARRLVTSGYLARVSARRTRGGQRWVPVDPDCAFAPLVRVRPALIPSRPVTAEAACLAGLADACGLGPRMFAYAPPNATRRCLDTAIGRLDPGLRHLIAQTQAAVDSAILSQRV
ncbi:MAG TPA: GPP34 family phosphoprotein [Streptosporangiaceae bacterium]